MLLDKERIDFQFTGASGTRLWDIHDKSGVIFKDVTSISDDYKVAVINWELPTQPSDGDLKSSTHEPALYMKPYRERKIVRGDGTVILDIPDIDIEKQSIKGKQVITSSGITNIFIHESSDDDNINISNGEMAVDNSVVLDVVNDQWKEYLYTKRDTDRQVVTNMAWKQALDNLFYMSYGGALIGSRSSTAQPLVNMIGQSANVSYPNGSYWAGSQVNGTLREVAPPGTRYNIGTPSLTGAGKRLAGAVGLAAGASIVTSLIDAHAMWQNQLLKEKQIRNEPTTALTIGDGIATVLNGLRNYYLIEQTVDDINYDRAYENFWKYGYWINKFEKPNIQSRKYFNYILTNGAIINGAINQAIRDVIASIFDAGVTIFHYDSGDLTTRLLEYTDKENIEVSLVNPTPTPETQYYTVENVQADHTIRAEFEEVQSTNYSVTNVQADHSITAEFEHE